jgi:Protein of unknown function (DUF2934)
MPSRGVSRGGLAGALNVESGMPAPAATLTAAPTGEESFDALKFREAREEMIRVAAYYIAEKRGFVPGEELENWLIAESEIDAILNE